MRVVLEKLGFSKYKREAYLALTRLGKGTVSQIAKHSNIPSNKLYSALEWLLQNGYVNQISQKPKTYRANNPKEILKTDIKERMQELQELQEKVDKIQTKFDLAEKGYFNIVYGRDAFFKKVKEVHRNTKKSVTGIFKSWRFDSELLELEKKNKKDRVKMRYLGPITKNTKSRVKERAKGGAEARHYIPDATRFTVWDERIIVISLRNEKAKRTEDYFSIWLDNPVLGKILTNHFNNLWDNAKKVRL
jgi:sugar-specific transcriptional regulator TrmB